MAIVGHAASASRPKHASMLIKHNLCYISKKTWEMKERNNLYSNTTIDTRYYFAVDFELLESYWIQLYKEQQHSTKVFLFTVAACAQSPWNLSSALSAVAEAKGAITHPSHSVLRAQVHTHTDTDTDTHTHTHTHTHTLIQDSKTGLDHKTYAIVQGQVRVLKFFSWFLSWYFSFLGQGPTLSYSKKFPVIDIILSI